MKWGSGRFGRQRSKRPVWLYHTALFRPDQLLDGNPNNVAFFFILCGSKEMQFFSQKCSKRAWLYRYPQFRDNNGHFTGFYWHLLSLRLGFVIIFEVGGPICLPCWFSKHSGPSNRDGILHYWPRRTGINPFTPKSGQFQISPPASPEILHHTVWRTWLFIAYSYEGWSYHFSLPYLYISL